MITPLLLSVFLQTRPASPTLLLDLDGDGVVETVTAAPHGKKIRIDVRDAAGKRRARAEAPAPESGVYGITLASGTPDGAGALFEVSAVDPRRECHTIWRLKEKQLSPVPIVGSKGKLADCSSPEGWTSRWKKPGEDSADEYLRERTRSTAEGEYHRVEVYRFSGSELTLDPARSTADIDGLSIPDWSPLHLYPRPLLETLLSCFDLSPFKTTPWLRIVTDRDEGVFALEVARPSATRRFSIRQGHPDPEKTEWLLTASDGERSGQIRLRLAADERHPLEVTVEGLEEDLRQSFVPVSRWSSRGVELFTSAEDELLIKSLVGDWDSSRGERISITSVSTNPAVADFGNQRGRLDIAQAPQGSDVILLPRDGSAPRVALLLRGPNVLTRMPVTCEPAKTTRPEACRVSGAGDSFRRVGSQLNTR